jgi:hypothetical protein
MKIYCKNKNCPYYEEHNEKVYLKGDSLIYVPFEADFYSGQCRKDSLPVGMYDSETRNTHYEVPFCELAESEAEEGTPSTCLCIECVYNEQEKCGKDKIFIAYKEVMDGNECIEEFWECKSFALKKIRGRINLNRFVDTNKNRIDDEMAGKIYEDSKKTKSFRTHTKPGKEYAPKPKITSSTPHYSTPPPEVFKARQRAAAQRRRR